MMKLNGFNGTCSLIRNAAFMAEVAAEPVLAAKIDGINDTECSQHK
jgi:hypothetical protein